MMDNKVITNPLDIDKIVRNELITQSELVSTRVLNGISVRGQNPLKVVADTENKVFTSFTTSDSFIVFEKEKYNDDRNNVSYTDNNDNDSLVKYVSYKIKVYVYGDSSDIVRNKLCARLLSQSVKSSLLEKGVFVYKIDNENTINEFVNNTMWIRNDFDLYVSCKYKFSQITSDYEPTEVGNINIEKL